MEHTEQCVSLRHVAAYTCNGECVTIEPRVGKAFTIEPGDRVDVPGYGLFHAAEVEILIGPNEVVLRGPQGIRVLDHGATLTIYPAPKD